MTSPTPLVARLRHRLVTMVWLLAFVVLAKGTLGALCIVDGATPPSDGAQVMVAADATSAHLDDEDGATCWHAGSGGCHCTCVHASAIPVTALDWIAARAASARIPLPAVASHPVLTAPALRPPIA
jgi:hypothetical protein